MNDKKTNSRAITEGSKKKGGINPRPSSPKPSKNPPAQK